MRFTERSEPMRARKRDVGDRDVGDRVRIGYLGSDFYTHPVGKIMLPILPSHDRSRFHVIAFHDGKKSDANTVAMKKVVDRFEKIHGRSDDEVIQRIRRDELDGLIDPGGYRLAAIDCECCRDASHRFRFRFWGIQTPRRSKRLTTDLPIGLPIRRD
jgi:predicted O-linked N-acetylglucosamine transferase (SPINDLY family)